jgi:hypothetical protein
MISIRNQHPTLKPKQHSPWSFNIISLKKKKKKPYAEVDPIIKK